MSQVTEQSVRFQTALASIKLIQASSVMDLIEDDFDFLTSNKVWIATDRSRARRCVEACVYGTLDFVGYPRFFFFSSRRRHTRCYRDWSSDVCSSDLPIFEYFWCCTFVGRVGDGMQSQHGLERCCGLKRRPEWFQEGPTGKSI